MRHKPYIHSFPPIAALGVVVIEREQQHFRAGRHRALGRGAQNGAAMAAGIVEGTQHSFLSADHQNRRRTDGDDPVIPPAREQLKPSTVNVFLTAASDLTGHYWPTHANAGRLPRSG